MSFHDAGRALIEPTSYMKSAYRVTFCGVIVKTTSGSSGSRRNSPGQCSARLFQAGGRSPTRAPVEHEWKPFEILARDSGESVYRLERTIRIGDGLDDEIAGRLV